MKPQQYAKAIIGAIVAGLGAAAAAWTGHHRLDAGDWIAVLIAFFVALAAVFAVPNAPNDQGGHTEITLVLEVATFIIVVLVALRVFSVV